MFGIYLLNLGLYRLREYGSHRANALYRQIVQSFLNAQKQNLGLVEFAPPHIFSICCLDNACDSYSAICCKVIINGKNDRIHCSCPLCCKMRGLQHKYFKELRFENSVLQISSKESLARLNQCASCQILRFQRYAMIPINTIKITSLQPNASLSAFLLSPTDSIQVMT